MITLKNITLKRGHQVLLEQVNWTIFNQQRIGIIGQNGSGKSSLFHLLLTGNYIESGELMLPKQVKFAHTAQEISPDDYEKTALEFVLAGDQELMVLQQQLLIAEQEDNGLLIAKLHEEMQNIDAYTAKSRAAQLLSGLSFSHHDQQQLVSTFSGGWRIRLNLARALIVRSDVLLLDEPTNHLDLDAVIWLEEWLQKYPGTLLLISHDRDFLDKTINHIAFLAEKHLTLYTGNYSTFETERARDLLTRQAAYEKQQKQIAHLQSFIDKFRAKATKAKQAQSRIKAIDRMEMICAVQTESDFQFEFKQPEPAGNPLISLDKASIAYDDHIVLKQLNLSITPTDRLAIIGPNGAGKSSFIKLLAGELSPHSGERVVNPRLKIGYFAQHQVDHLQLTESALWHLRELAENKKTDTELRSFLGTFAFSGNKVLEPVSHFSGGEKSRLALALLVWQKPNLLLLDEPTNHLDLEMRQALSIALQTFEGAMILVTHDRFLIRSTTDQLLLAAHQELRPFDGDLNDYQQWLINYRKENINNNINNKNNSLQENQTNQAKREKLKLLLKQINQLEKKLAQLQEKLSQINTKLSDNLLYESNNPNNQNLLKEQILLQTKIKEEISQLEEEWMIACEERDQIL